MSSFSTDPKLSRAARDDSVNPRVLDLPPEAFLGGLTGYSCKLDLLSEDQKQAVVDILLAMSMADGRIVHAELREIELGLLASPAFAKTAVAELERRVGVAVRRYSRAACEEGGLQRHLAATVKHLRVSMREPLFKMAACVICCDGELYQREHAMLFGLAEAWGLSQREVDRWFEEVLQDAARRAT